MITCTKGDASIGDEVHLNEKLTSHDSISVMMG